MWAIFSIENCVWFLTRAYRIMNSFLAERLWLSKPPNYSKIRQKVHGHFKNLIFFGNFVIFGLNFRHLSKTNWICFFEASGTTNSFLVERFYLSKLASVSKVRQNLHENNKNQVIFSFCHFWSQLEPFFVIKLRLLLNKSLLDYELFLCWTSSTF